MSEKISYGLDDAKVGTTDPVTGLGANMVDIGKIYKDTMDMTESDITQASFYSQQDPNNAALVLNGGSNEIVKLSLMDTSAANMVKYCGGTSTSVDGVNTWHKPKFAPNIEMAFEFTTTDGAKVEIPRGSVIGKKVFKVADNAIWVLELTITPMSSKVAGVDSVMISDPVVEEEEG